jgi:hypothetical protein
MCERHDMYGFQVNGGCQVHEDCVRLAPLSL